MFPADLGPLLLRVLCDQQQCVGVRPGSGGPGGEAPQRLVLAVPGGELLWQAADSPKFTIGLFQDSPKGWERGRTYVISFQNPRLTSRGESGHFNIYLFWWQCVQPLLCFQPSIASFQYCSTQQHQNAKVWSFSTQELELACHSKISRATLKLMGKKNDGNVDIMGSKYAYHKNSDKKLAVYIYQAVKINKHLIL